MAFNADDYLLQKVADLNRTGYQGKTWDLNSTMAAFNEAGLTPEQHYQQYGKNEGFYNPTPSPQTAGQPGSGLTSTTPSLYPTPFNIDAYMQNKVAQLNDIGYQGKTWDLASTLDAFREHGLTPQQHYEKYGQYEGVNHYTPYTPYGHIQDTASQDPPDGHIQDTASQEPPVDIFQPDKYQQSRSGLPEEYQLQILESLIPKLLESVEGYEGNIDKSTQAAQELFETQSRRGMKDQLQGILNSLAGRNILNSSVASDAISKGMGDIVQTGAQKGYESQMTNAALKAQLPALLANIAQLGQSSTSSDPLEPYKLLSQYDWNLM
jgi:hypothetical protein